MSGENAKRIPMITAARLGWVKDRIQEMVLKEKKKEHKLFHIVGTATQALVKPSDTYEGSESVEFRGAFLAIDAETGEQYKAGKAYLPSIIEAELAATVQKNSAVELAMTVTATYAEKSATSYSFGILSHGKEDNSAFDSLLALIPGMKALPAPEAGAKKKR